jgi:hypothetical protein
MTARLTKRAVGWFMPDGQKSSSNPLNKWRVEPLDENIFIFKVLELAASAKNDGKLLAARVTLRQPTKP